METKAAIAALSALAQEARLTAFRLLVAAGPAGLPAGRIAEQLAVPANTLSFHLNHLKAAGLVSCRRDGRSLIYSADYTRMQELLGYLTANCCSGSTCEEA
jgi:ArsR family transcriptional regulator